MISAKNGFKWNDDGKKESKVAPQSEIWRMATWPSWVRQVFREKFWKSFKLRKHSELQTLCQKLLYSLRKSQRGCLFTFSSLSRFCCSTSSRSPTNRFTLKKREGHYKSLFWLTFVLGRVWDETRKFVKSVNFYRNKKSVQSDKL